MFYVCFFYYTRQIGKANGYFSVFCVKVPEILPSTKEDTGMCLKQFTNSFLSPRLSLSLKCWSHNDRRQRVESFFLKLN